MSLRLTALFLLGLLLSSCRAKVAPDNVSGGPSPSPSSAFPSSLFNLGKNEHELKSVFWNNQEYRYAVVIVNPKDVTMGVNNRLASDSASLAKVNNCQYLTNGGFYDKNGKPIGLIISNGKRISSWQSNSLFNGVLGWSESMSDLEIVQGESSKAYEWAIQAGPIIWQNKEPRLLQLQRDQSARRIIAGITDDEKLSLLVITAKDSLFYGPLLAEVPSIVSAILAQQRDLKLTAAINLDGGTASAFLTPTLQLKELQPIGSYLCSR